MCSLHKPMQATQDSTLRSSRDKRKRNRNTLHDSDLAKKVLENCCENMLSEAIQELKHLGLPYYTDFPAYPDEKVFYIKSASRYIMENRFLISRLHSELDARNGEINRLVEELMLIRLALQEAGQKTGNTPSDTDRALSFNQNDSQVFQMGIPDHHEVKDVKSNDDGTVQTLYNDSYRGTGIRYVDEDLTLPPKTGHDEHFEYPPSLHAEVPESPEFMDRFVLLEDRRMFDFTFSSYGQTQVTSARCQRDHQESTSRVIPVASMGQLKASNVFPIVTARPSQPLGSPQDHSEHDQYSTCQGLPGQTRGQPSHSLASRFSPNLSESTTLQHQSVRYVPDVTPYYLNI